MQCDSMDFLNIFSHDKKMTDFLIGTTFTVCGCQIPFFAPTVDENLKWFTTIRNCNILLYIKNSHFPLLQPEYNSYLFFVIDQHKISHNWEEDKNTPIKVRCLKNLIK